MGTHFDNDHKEVEAELRRSFLRELEIRAETMADLGKNDLQQGRQIRRWDHDGVTVTELPEDRQGILRISIGGGDHLPVHGDYCNFRGDQSRVIRLLEKALAAMKAR